MILKRFLLVFCLFTAPFFSYAQEDAAPTEGTEYVELTPPFIVTFGGPGPLKYLKTEVTLVILEGAAEEKVKLHQPPLRNSLVMLLSRQRSEDIATAVGRDKLRLDALEELRQIMVAEYGESGNTMIKDLLFTSFVVQQ
jgi:flagellar FliL protein